MEKTQRKKPGRKPQAFPTLTTKEFEVRSLYSRQRPRLLNAVKRVLVHRETVLAVASKYKLTPQGLTAGTNRFLLHTSAPVPRMFVEDFEGATRGVRNPTAVQAARLYLVHGYSVPGTYRATGLPSSVLKEQVSHIRKRVNLARSGVRPLPPVTLKDQYTVADPDWQWPTDAEFNALTASHVVRPLSRMAYARAFRVLVMKTPPKQVAKLTSASCLAVLKTLDLVVQQLNRFRLHMQYPKSADYLSTLHKATELFAHKQGLRLAVERYLGCEADLEKTAALYLVNTQVLANAVRYTTHRMAKIDATYK